MSQYSSTHQLLHSSSILSNNVT